MPEAEKIVVRKRSYSAVARLDWYRRLTCGFSHITEQAGHAVSQRHSSTKVGTKLLVHHVFAFLSPDQAGN